MENQPPYIPENTAGNPQAALKESIRQRTLRNLAIFIGGINWLPDAAKGSAINLLARLDIPIQLPEKITTDRGSKKGRGLI